MKKFCVYVHFRESDGLPFYVGKGLSNRPKDFRKRSEFWKRVKNKHGVKVKIVAKNLSEDESFLLEKFLISHYRLLKFNLANLSNGGEGPSGYKYTPEQSERLSKALKGIKRTPEQIEFMRQRTTGRKHNPETRRKMSDYHSKAKLQLDRNTYCFLSEYEMFVGTREELAKTYNFDKRKLRTLFWEKYQKTCMGWSVLRINNKPLIIFKET